MNRRERGVRVIGIFIAVMVLSAGGLLWLGIEPTPTGLEPKAPTGALLVFDARVDPIDRSTVELRTSGASTATPALMTGLIDPNGELAKLGKSSTKRAELAGIVVSPGRIRLMSLHTQTLQYVALIMVLMCGVLLYDGTKSLPELDGERIVLESSSRFRHVVEYGLTASGAGLTFAADEAMRRLGIVPPWGFMWGTILFLTMPLVILSFYIVAPRLCTWIGIGTRMSDTGPRTPP